MSGAVSVICRLLGVSIENAAAPLHTLRFATREEGSPQRFTLGTPMPTVTGVLETSLYVDDLERAARFYEDVLGLKALTSDARFRAYDVGGRSVLLVFQRGATLETVVMPGGTIPPHDGHGPLHIALAIPLAELPEWENRLAAHGVPIEGRTHWRRGGDSIYFRDPDGHLLELATPGLWATY